MKARDNTDSARYNRIEARRSHVVALVIIIDKEQEWHTTISLQIKQNGSLRTRPLACQQQETRLLDGFHFSQ